MRRSTRVSKRLQDNGSVDIRVTKRPAEDESSTNPPKAKRLKAGTAPAKNPVAAKTERDTHDIDADIDDDGPSYWLMKAEPESRIEKGVDVKFSIDDLAAVEEEGWDGVRNFVARNNMRAMKKGEHAFFYHSNCKTPGIAGIMEIVREHSVDETAQNPKHPYYDAKSTPDNPKWSLVHVKFRQKFPNIISLKELQKYKGPGGALENLQTLKQSRLSVSKVSKPEWDFILRLVDDK